MSIRTWLHALPVSLMNAVQRFPLPTLATAFFTAIAFEAVRHSELQDPRVLLALFCLLFAWIAVRLYAERYRWSTRREWLTSIVLGAVIGAAYYLTPDPAATSGFLAPACFLAMLIAPYAAERGTDLEFYHFALQVLQRICFTVVAALILFAGIAGIVGSLDYLFGIQSNPDFYAYLWIFSAALFSPLFAMAGIPREFDGRSDIATRKIVVLFCNLAIPLLAIYAVILYAYVAKLAFLQSLPRGGIVYIVSGFGLAGTVVFFSVYPLMLAGHKVAEAYRRWFYPLLILPLLLLALAIGVRLSDYGITEERYGVVLCFIWLSSAIGLSWKRDAQPLRGIVLVLAGLLLFGAIGPQSAVSLSVMNQKHRLQNALEGYGLLADGKIISKPSLSFNERKALSGQLDYFKEEGKSAVIAPWFAQDASLPVRSSDNGFYELTLRRMKQMGQDYVSSYETEENTMAIQYNLSYSNEFPALRVKNYDYLTAQIAISVSSDSNTILKTVLEGERVLETQLRATELSVSSPGGTPLVFDLIPLLNEAYKRGLEAKRSGGAPTLSTQPMALTMENGEMRVTVLFDSFWGKMDGTEPRIESMGCRLLVKLKK